MEGSERVEGLGQNHLDKEAEWDPGSQVGRGGGAAPTPPTALGPTAGLVGKRPVSRADFSPMLGGWLSSSPSNPSFALSWRKG